MLGASSVLGPQTFVLAEAPQGAPLAFMKSAKLKEADESVQRHEARKRQSWDSNLEGLSAPSASQTRGTSFHSHTHTGITRQSRATRW